MPDDEVISLARFLARSRSLGSGKKLADALLDDPDAARLVPSLPVQELFWAIQEIGLADAHELVALASPEQVRGFLDLAAWQRGELQPERAAEWIDALTDLGPEKLARAVEALDPEFVALWLRRQITVYDLSIETPAEEALGHFYPTPDSFYLLDVHPPGDAGKRVERFIDWLYRADLELGRRVVMGARWALDAELAEEAYRWRSGRMADLGFVEFYEALEVYRFLDPATVKIGEDTAEPRDPDAPSVPRTALAPVGGATFLAQTLARIEDEDEQARLHDALLTLANRVMAADAVEPGDPAAASATLERVFHYLSLALEYLARSDAAVAAGALSTVALARLFRVGVSLTLKLRQAAETLLAHGLVTLVPGRASLLDPPYSTQLLALLRVPVPVSVPVYVLGAAPRPFSTLAEIAEVAALLDEIAQLSSTIVRGLGVDPARLTAERLGPTQPAIDAITFHTIAATLIANALLDRLPALVPLAPADLAVLRDLALLDGHLRPAARERASRLVSDRLAERAFDPPPALPRFIDAWLAQLERALAPSTIGSPAGTLLPPEGLLVRA